MKVLIYPPDNLSIYEKDALYIEECLQRVIDINTMMILTGSAEQIEISKKIAEKLSIPTQCIKTECNLVNSFVDVFVIFWDGVDKQTRDIILDLKASGKNLKVFFYDPVTAIK